jgi:hypothetical protein
MTASMTTPKTVARTEGVLYLLLADPAFNDGCVLLHVAETGDAAVTADNVRASAIYGCPELALARSRANGQP